MSRTIIGAVAIVAAFSAIGPVFAAENDHASREIVSYGELDVSHTAGAQVLLARIEQASERVCGGKPDPFDLKLRELYGHCYVKAMNSALSQVNQPLLTELYGKPVQNVGEAMNAQDGSQYVAENIGAESDRPGLFERIAKALF